MNPSKNPSAIRSKGEITDALLKLMRDFPYDKITVKQIILEACVARKTFYRNFTCKNDVLYSYIDGIMSEYVSLIQQPMKNRLTKTLDIIFSFCLQNKGFLFLLRDNSLMHILLEKWNTLIPTIHGEIIGKDCDMLRIFFRQELSYVIAFNIGAIWNLIIKWVENDMNDSPESIKETIIKYIKYLSSKE